MFKLRVYIDTSVVGGCLDEEFKEDSVQLFDEFIKGMKTPVISDILLFEVEGAPKEVKNILKKVPTENIEYVALNEESIALANKYIEEGSVAEKSFSDARHIAIATVERVDVLVSWNFKHIVHFDKIRLFNSINMELGYKPIEIYSPREVTTIERD